MSFSRRSSPPCGECADFRKPQPFCQGGVPVGGRSFPGGHRGRPISALHVCWSNVGEHSQSSAPQRSLPPSVHKSDWNNHSTLAMFANKPTTKGKRTMGVTFKRKVGIFSLICGCLSQQKSTDSGLSACLSVSSILFIFLCLGEEVVWGLQTPDGSVTEINNPVGPCVHP